MNFLANIDIFRESAVNATEYNDIYVSLIIASVLAYVCSVILYVFLYTMARDYGVIRNTAALRAKLFMDAAIYPSLLYATGARFVMVVALGMCLVYCFVTIWEFLAGYRRGLKLASSLKASRENVYQTIIFSLERPNTPIEDRIDSARAAFSAYIAMLMPSFVNERSDISSMPNVIGFTYGMGGLFNVVDENGKYVDANKLIASKKE